ncbi:hypothetical protein CR513_19133, partial [Mucuna pruriens]
MNTVRVVLSIAAHFGWNLQQFDIKNIFLHGNLEEEVYVEIFLGFYSRNEKNKSQGNHTLFIKHSHDGKLIFLLVYVDDMIVTGDDEIEKLTLIENMATQFEMKELGKLKYFLGIEVTYSKQGIFISQRKYVLNLLKETGKLGCKTLGVPIEQNHRIRKEGTLSIEIYTDADYAGLVVDRRSTSRYCMFLGGNLVTWKRKKKNVRKHIEIDRHFIKEKSNNGLVVTAHVPTRLQVVNVSTKGFLVVRFQELNSKLRMIDIHLPT